jgi:ferritin-like metal-binding protein YciE
MKMKTLHDLFVHELKDLHSAEKQLLRALPKMAKAASSDDLKQAFESHLAETEEHVTRLDQIFEQLDISNRGHKCKAMEGLIEEGKDLLAEDIDSEVLDAALISAAQRVEHYEIAGYGCARTFARRLGLEDIAQMLQQTLDEEGTTDQKLTDIAESHVNEEAVA